MVDKKSDKKAGSWNNLAIGIGDDTAAWKTNKGIQLITTDVLVEGTHFDFVYTGWKDLGWKSIAINISDIYAMGGTPLMAIAILCWPVNTIPAEIAGQVREGAIAVGGVVQRRAAGLHHLHEVRVLEQSVEREDKPLAVHDRRPRPQGPRGVGGDQRSIAPVPRQCLGEFRWKRRAVRRGVVPV